jgi:hypothetical protein
MDTDSDHQMLTTSLNMKKVCDKMVAMLRYLWRKNGSLWSTADLSLPIWLRVTSFHSIKKMLLLRDAPSIDGGGPTAYTRALQAISVD